MPRQFATFRAFYPYYLEQHQHPWCRACHYLGSTLVLANLLAALYWQSLLFVILMPLCGYGFAWLGHFAFERNRPATFSHPFYSLAADWVMYFRWLFRRA
ncbi:DUF962 domain-containing protein [Pseudoalteromonas sp. S16_S37]|uniref:DUF962 domain-containing protein n=1 Tax=Pseudoalteromonas sp. S16_S37 TaxID=2720228 RepID=UPI001680F277|nr:DUF962 domain-containing protein [Pseudoalteromonas sp. S16_S37]MBD1581201.1 DUF962 domain-containing protein [Pseudoalteromonas sp. S16_S37]